MAELPPDAEPSTELPQSWLRSDRVLARRIGRPVQEFLGVEAAGGGALLLATIVALVWANSARRLGYVSFTHTSIALEVGGHGIRMDLQHWVNDGLMTIFFLMVGMEIKQEAVVGELRDRRAAMLPAFAAAGGMIVPALIFLAINLGGVAAHGWGVPMATDIAFAVGVVAVLGSRVPPPLKVFLLTLAVVDDIGVIVVIALVYSSSVSWAWLGGALVLLLSVIVVKRMEVRYLPVYALLGAAMWLCLYESGVHPTLAGVVMGLLTPALPFMDRVRPADVLDHLPIEEDRSVHSVQEARFMVRETVSPTERITHALHPWSAFVVVPIFALVNAGIPFTGRAITSPQAVTVGVIVGLVIGKPLGITVFSWLAIRLGFGSMPSGVRFGQLAAVAVLGGIGFTVSLFVAGLAFPGRPLLSTDAKVGVLVASAIAAVSGAVALLVTTRSGARSEESVPS